MLLLFCLKFLLFLFYFVEIIIIFCCSGCIVIELSFRNKYDILYKVIYFEGRILEVIIVVIN